MTCIFCDIVKGKAKCYKIYEDSKNLAFLDIFPNTKGQSLVIPKKHFENFIEMPEKDFQSLMKAAKKVSSLLRKAFKIERVAMVIEGTAIPHVHVKLYPLHGKLKADIKKKVYFKKYPGYLTTLIGPRASEKALQKLAEKIRSL